MGRSVPTYRMRLEMLIAELRPFRRALREEDRAAFDSLMNRARGLASAAGYQAAADPLDTAFLSMLVGMERELGALRRRVIEMEEVEKNADVDGGSVDGSGEVEEDVDGGSVDGSGEVEEDVREEGKAKVPAGGEGEVERGVGTADDERPKARETGRGNGGAGDKG